MFNYTVKEIMISQQPKQNEEGQPTEDFVYQVAGMTKKRQDDTMSQEQTQKVFDKLGDAVLWSQDYFK